MLDALQLALAVVGAIDLHGAVHRFEEAMCERAAEASAMAIANQRRVFLARWSAATRQDVIALTALH